MKKIIKSTLPPIFLEFIRVIRRKINTFLGQKPVYAYEVFKNKDEFKGITNKPYESETWLAGVENSILTNFKNKPNIHNKAVLDCISILYNIGHFKNICIIDFGGGGGILVPYIDQIKQKLSINNINVIVMDTEPNIKIGKKILYDKDYLHFFDSDKHTLPHKLKHFNSKSDGVILNFASVLQYIIPWESFLNDVFSVCKPILVCITRFPRCEDAVEDAFSLHNLKNCGSLMVNLFSSSSLVKFMNKKGYELLFEKYSKIGDTFYHHAGCQDKNYKKITLVAYTFILKRT